MCYLGSNKDPTCTSSLELSVEQVAQRVNRITDTKIDAEQKWGMNPYDHSNQIAEVCCQLHLMSFFSAGSNALAGLTRWSAGFACLLTGFTCLLLLARAGSVSSAGHGGQGGAPF
jgi:hypothetical protein